MCSKPLWHSLIERGYSRQDAEKIGAEAAQATRNWVIESHERPGIGAIVRRIQSEIEKRADPFEHLYR